MDALRAVRPRSELELVDIDPPHRLAPHSFAMGVELSEDAAAGSLPPGAETDEIGRAHV